MAIIPYHFFNNKACGKTTRVASVDFIKNQQDQKSGKGFALLISVIFMSVMLTFGLQLASIGYKQSTLSASALKSQYAFYAADTALECALYADQHDNLFAYPASSPASAPRMTCDNVQAPPPSFSWNASRFIVTSRLSLDGGTHCADVMVSKPNPALSLTTYVYSQGYSVPCATLAAPEGVRFSSRGMSARY